MWAKISAVIKKNKIILFSFAALVSFSVTIIRMNMKIVIDNRTININSSDSQPAPAVETTPARIEETASESVTIHKPVHVQAPVLESEKIIQSGRFYRDSLSEARPSKSYSFVLNEPDNINIIFINDNKNKLDVSVYVVDILNPEGISLLKGGHNISGRTSKFETGYMFLEPGKYRIKVSKGSVFNEGPYRLWIRH